MKILLAIILLIINYSIHATDTCSRVATINYQDILIDTSSTKKGEGLRYYLNKDPKAKQFLDKYQDNNKIRWQNAAFGTIGTGLILAGVLSHNDDDSKKNLIFGGIITVTLNYLISRTIENSNEENLIRSIREYNIRNLPKIYFNPKNEDNKSPSIFLNKTWDF